MSLPEWWLTVGWRRTVLEDYWLALLLAFVWWLVPVSVRVNRVRNWRRAAGSAVWYVPVLAWMLGAMLHALNSTQMDLTGPISRVPFMWMYAGSSAVAGIAVLLLCAATAMLAGARGRGSEQRVWGPYLVVLAWAGAAVVWVWVVVREIVVIQGR